MARTRPEPWMVEAEGERLDGRVSANRALLVSPRPGGLIAPSPSRERCWDGSGQPGCHDQL